ncbi:MAG TPA: A/G-specific adenine glycosylase [Puia sp.]|nr:A/G-specific adenine glycosylase [Puia sp.]
MQNDFTKKLLKWNRNQNNRSMPWKGESDPYRIWLSEIILQQTRVEQGIAYYKKFISIFPTINDLVRAPEKEIFKYWEGLGYYTRCRNLIITAKIITLKYGGHFPSSYAEILELPGIGPYTAAAIASFAFGLPYAVVDGNVERIIARYFGIKTIVGSAAGKKKYTKIATELLDRKNPAVYNQAIMDFGATICKPQNPLCTDCNLAKNCYAFQKGMTNEFPLKKPSLLRKKRWLYYFIVNAGKDKIWIRKRTEKDIWQNLYEFILWETGKIIPQDKLHKTSFFQDNFGKQGFRIQRVSPAFSQILTHQSITGLFVHLNKPLDKLAGYQSVPRESLKEYPFPKIITDYIKNSPLL